MERIQKVNSASFEILKSKPVTLALFAIGTVSSSGSTKGALSAWFYIEPPEDGIQDFDFNAEPPTGIVLPVQTPIVSDPIILLYPRNYWGEGKPILGARIHARQNTIEIAFDDQGWIAAVSDLKGPVFPTALAENWRLGRRRSFFPSRKPFPHAVIAGKRNLQAFRKRGSLRKLLMMQSHLPRVRFIPTTSIGDYLASPEGTAVLFCKMN